MEETLKLVLQELKRLGDGQERIDVRMGNMEDRMGGLETRMGGLEDRMSGLEDRMGTVEGRMGTVEGRLSGVEGRLSGVEDRLSGVEGEMKEVKAGLKSVQELGQATFDQVGMLTEFRTETNAKLDRLSSTLSEQGQVIDRLAFRSLAQEADIVALKRAK